MRHLLLVLMIALSAVQASATTVSRTLMPLGSDTWEASYTVQNDSLGTPIEWFAVWFDYELFDDLALVSAPLAWDVLVFPTAPNLPEDGALDALVLDPADAIDPGAAAGEFVARFLWLGDGPIPEQLFQIYSDLSVIDEGSTITTVPLPASAWLMASALAAGAAFRRKRRLHDQ